MPITKASSSAVAPGAKGDLVVGTTTNDSGILAVGANNTVLTADSTTATGLKWAAPATGGGFNLISRTSFTNVAQQNFDNVFNSTYRVYKMVIENLYSATNTTTDDVILQLRYGTSQTQAQDYYGVITRTTFNGTVTQNAFSGTTDARISTDIGDVTNNFSSELTFYKVGNSADMPIVQVFGVDGYTPAYQLGFFTCFVSRIYTGVALKASTNNITGTVAFYGLAVS